MDDQNLGETSHVNSLGKAEEFSGNFSQTEQFTEPLDSSQVERTKKASKYNLRKSLAWDAGFFTSAGVLDPDELSSMIDGGSGGKRLVLPGIEEDMHRSTDSLSTLGSENLSLESLEFDFFQDIRASIQKSSKASNGANPHKAALVDAGNQGTLSLNDNLAPNNVANSSAGPKKQASRIQTPGKLKVQSSNGPQGTGKQPAAGMGVLTPSLQKATKVNGRPTAGPSAAVGRLSVKANKAQLENDKAKALHKVAPVPKVPGVSGSIRTVPKPVLSSKSSSSGSSTASRKEPPKLSSSSDSSTSIASANSNPRKVASRSVNPTASKFIRKTPSRVAMKKKGENGLSASLRSPKLSASISPASSISEWSVASSSSTSSVNQCSSTMRAITAAGSPCKSRDGAATSNDVHRSTDQGLDRPENKVSQPYSEKPNSASAQMGPPPKPATAKPSGLRITGPPPKLETAKPSGLRMPSPKIGFFDGAKSVVNTPSGTSQSRSGISSVPKVGPAISTPTGILSKAKSPNFQPTRLAKPIGNIKLDTLKSASPLASKKVSNATTIVHSSPKLVETPLKMLTLTPSEPNEKKLLKTEETGVKELSETNGGKSEMLSLVEVKKKSSAKIAPADEDGKIASVEKEEALKLISEENGIADDFKSDVNLDEQMSSNLVKIDPLDGEVYNSEGKMASEVKKNEVTSITVKISPADMKNGMNFDVKMSANSGDMEFVPVDGNIYDSHRKMLSGERNHDVNSSTEQICLADLKSNINLEGKMNANSGNMEIVPVDEDIYDCQEKMVSEEKDAISISKNISLDDLESDIKLDIKMNADSVNYMIVPADGDVENGGDGAKLNTEKTGCRHVICEINLDEKSCANLVNVNVATVDRDIYERELVCHKKRDDQKSGMQRLIHNWNSLQKSAKEDQVGGLSLDAVHGYLEHDLQKKNGSNFISSPRDFRQTEELLSNSSKINQKSEIIGSKRTPFTDKNSTCNDYDLSTELSAGGIEKIILLPSLECPPAEN